MRNLIAAGMFRLVRSKVLYAAMGAVMFLETYSLLPTRDSLRMLTIPLEKPLFTVPLFMVLVVPSFCGLFFGVEYGSGTLRNKLISGIAKWKIYLSNLVMTMGVALVLTFAALLTGLALGLFCQGKFESDPAVLLQYVVCSLGVALTISSFSVMATMLFSNRAVGLLVAVMTSLALLFVGQFLFQAFLEPEFTRPTERVMENGMVSYIIDMNAPEEPNPYYPRGIQRMVYQFLFYFLPQGQSFQIAFLGLDNPLLCLGSAALFVALTTGLGLVLFQKKDIK